MVARCCNHFVDHYQQAACRGKSKQESSDQVHAEVTSRIVHQFQRNGLRGEDLRDELLAYCNPKARKPYCLRHKELSLQKEAMSKVDQ